MSVNVKTRRIGGPCEVRIDFHGRTYDHIKNITGAIIAAATMGSFHIAKAKGEEVRMYKNRNRPPFEEPRKGRDLRDA